MNHNLVSTPAVAAKQPVNHLSQPPHAQAVALAMLTALDRFVAGNSYALVHVLTEAKERRVVRADCGKALSGT